MFQVLKVGSISIQMYNLLNFAGVVVLVLWVIAQTGSFAGICPQARRQTSEKKRRLAAAGVFLMITAAGFLLLLLLNQKFGDWFTNGNKNYYGSLTAWCIVFFVFSFLLKIPVREALDLFTPGLPLSLAVSKLACVCYGCCHSFKMPGSFYYNLVTDRKEFPVQMLEAAVALLLFLFFLWYRKRPYRTGTLFPLYVILYSTTRFFTEFLRADLPDVAGIFDAYQIMSAVYLGIGLIWFLTVQKTGDRSDGK